MSTGIRSIGGYREYIRSLQEEVTSCSLQTQNAERTKAWFEEHYRPPFQLPKPTSPFSFQAQPLSSSATESRAQDISAILKNVYNQNPTDNFINESRSLEELLALDSVEKYRTNSHQEKYAIFSSRLGIVLGFAVPLSVIHLDQMAFHHMLSFLEWEGKLRVCTLFSESEGDRTSLFCKECFTMNQDGVEQYASPLEKFLTSSDWENKTNYNIEETDLVKIALLDLLFQNMDLSSIILAILNQTIHFRIDNPLIFPETQRRILFFQTPVGQFIYQNFPSVLKNALEESFLRSLQDLPFREVLLLYFPESPSKTSLILDRVHLFSSIIGTLRNIDFSPVTIENISILFDVLLPLAEESRKIFLDNSKQVKKTLASKSNQIQKSLRSPRQLPIAQYNCSQTAIKLQQIIMDNLEYFNIPSIERTAHGTMPPNSIFILFHVPFSVLKEHHLIDAHQALNLYKSFLRDDITRKNSLTVFSNSSEYNALVQAILQPDCSSPMLVGGFKNDSSPIKQAASALLHSFSQEEQKNISLHLQCIRQLTNQQLKLLVDPLEEREERIEEHKKRISSMYAGSLFPYPNSEILQKIKEYILIFNELFYYLFTHIEEMFPERL
ncbi:MAG: hypothetical protein JW769_01590 [Parachlamydiales bacterium]|nr:hypothetical protein [Parachlamydiales bacterium]